MRFGANAFILISQLGLACALGVAPSHAQTISGSPTIVLKNGESSELGNVYWVSHCKSLLRGTPEVEVVEGPPGVSVTIKEAMVLPRLQNCARRVPGGTMVISANEVEDPSYTKLTVRVTFRTKDGERKYGQVFNLSLLP
jgi:hypothetical protein